MQHRRIRLQTSIKAALMALMGFLLCSSPALSFDPTFILGGSAEQNSYEGGESTLWLDGYGVGAWRTTIESGGYAVLEGSASLSYSPEGKGMLLDNEALEGTLGITLPGSRWENSLGMYSSLDDIDDGTVLRPHWSSRYSLTLESPDKKSDIEPYIEYSGYHLYEELGAEDRQSHTGVLGITYEPSFKRSYRLQFDGSGRWWRRDYTDALSTAAVSSDERRRDIILAGEFEISGLAGYFADWAVSLRGGTSRSNDENYLTADGLEELGTDTNFGRLDAELSWSPRRELDISAGLSGEGRRFLDRKAQREDGSLPLTAIDIGGGVSANWTKDDKTFFLLKLSGVKTISNDPLVDTWSFSIGGGIEYGF